MKRPHETYKGPAICTSVGGNMPNLVEGVTYYIECMPGILPSRPLVTYFDRDSGERLGTAGSIRFDIEAIELRDRLAKLEQLLADARDAWPQAQTDEEIDGSDAVEWLVGWLDDVNKVIGD